MQTSRGRRDAGQVIAVAVFATLLGGCAGAGGPPVQTYPRYTFSCCAAADLQGWFPGKPVDLHWVTQLAGHSADRQHVPITITATLAGPYADVASLKAGIPSATTLPLATLIADNRVPTPLVSSFTLPTDLAPGLYNVAVTYDYGGGNGWSTASVVQVWSSGSAAEAGGATGQPPLNLPVVAPGAICPASPMVSLLGVGPNYGFGTLPAFLSGQTSWYAGGQGAFLMVASSYTGSLLIRGAQLDGAGTITLAEDDLPPSAGAGITAKERANGVELVAGVHPGAGALKLEAEPSATLWRGWSGILSTSGPGCFGLQVDGEGFTKFIVFPVLPGSPPPG